MFKPAVTVVALALIGALAGCAMLGGPNVGFSSREKDSLDAISREDLVMDISACHLLRVSQTNDVAATDATVIVATDRYRIPVETIVSSADDLLLEYRSAPADLIAIATDACQRLAEETGVVSALVRFEPNGELRTSWLRIDDAEILPGFAKRTIGELRRRRAIGLVINSPGGSVYEARILGRYLRSNGLRAAVDRICVSACVDVLAGGVERYVTRDARLGIHQSKVPNRYSSHEGGQLYVADSFLYLREMGVDPDVAIVAASVPNDKILIIPLDEALATGLVTGIVEGFE
ncbi:COG3904 family protein [Imhoffiella purpurea]|uniref:Periplasmic protein-like protein n=1 Tax=Imhoffiella purpurea TaxID=1249627 RepID=W9VB20_9GAMM|nr:hypothetical protein [Imhoffiella purpurea]EXJ16634.1 hypothetical protein D779_4187 [Imhoffiella purpurea]